MTSPTDIEIVIQQIVSNRFLIHTLFTLLAIVAVWNLLMTVAIIVIFKTRRTFFGSLTRWQEIVKKDLKQ